MVVEDQSEVIAFLSRPESYGAGVTTVERIDTHAAMVFLAGERAYKLKRAVRFAYLDYSTTALRCRFCEAELALSRRTAPQLYLSVRSLNRIADGRLAFDAPGPVVDCVVEMRRFDQSDLFDAMAARGALTEALMLELAEAIARFHAEAAPAPGMGGTLAIFILLALTGSSFGVVITHCRAFMPPHLIGRGVTAMNFVSIGAVGLSQLATGRIVEAATDPADPTAAYAALFASYALVLGTAVLVYLFSRDVPPERASARVETADSNLAAEGGTKNP